MCPSRAALLSTWAVVCLATSACGASVKHGLDYPEPSAAPITVPAKIEAEAYAGMARVQLEPCSEGTQQVGWIDSGDWMDYTITVPTTGSYTIQYRVASSSSAGVITSSHDLGATSSAPVGVPNTGGLHKWQTISQTVTLPAGIYDLRVLARHGGFNLNWINIISNGAANSAG